MIPSPEDLLDLRGRNQRLRSKILQTVVNAPARVEAEVERIASEMPVFDDEARDLEATSDNLRLRADALIRGGAATPADFEGLVWPRG
jgi:hypothetical protein